MHLVFGLWSMALVPLNNTLWLFFCSTKVHAFLWDFRVLFFQVDLLDTSNCTSFSNFNENEG